MRNVVKNFSESKNILILNKNKDKTSHLKGLCSEIGSAYTARNLSETISLLAGTELNVAVVDAHMARYSHLKGLFKKSTSIIITGPSMTELKHIIREWPENHFVDIFLYSDLHKDNYNFLRMLFKAIEHSRLLMETENLRFSYEKNGIELQEAFYQIDEIKKFLKKSVVSELEKRISIESRYNWFKNEKQRIENILKKLYMANDVTYLLDIVYDIKDLIKASGISVYILEESDATGKFLKPLVWDDSILSHADFTKHIIPLEAQDFAANTALHAHEINTSEFTYDKRLSDRYKQDLESALMSILCVPIMHQKDVIGVLEVYNKNYNGHPTKSGFTKEDQQILRQLSEHISIAITKLNLIQYDPLTGLLRPDPFFDKIVHKLQSERKRHLEEYAYALVMGDVDWFKNYNDRNGHEAGNKILRELAGILKSSTRDIDLVCRYGGEEFLFFLTGIKDSAESFTFTDRIRRNIENHYFTQQEFQPNGNLTMSFGITNFSRDRFKSHETVARQDLKKIVSEADRALAEAKGKKHFRGASEKSEVKNTIRVYESTQKEASPEKDTTAPHTEPYAKEKRKHHRYYTSTPLIYKNGSDQKVTKTINISMGGVKFFTEELLNSEQILDLTIILESQALDCKGNVVYSEKGMNGPSAYFSGLEFTDITAKNKKKLENYVTSLETMKELIS